MAKQRYINTKFWSDNWIIELDPIERYLFLYFLTNEHTNIAGIYELPLRTMAFETGIEKEMLVKMLPRFEGKVYYFDGWIYVKNFQKHQSSTSKTVITGIEVEMSKIPLEIKEKINKVYGIDTLSDPIIYLNPNLNLNLNSNTKESKVLDTPIKKVSTINYLSDIPLEDMKEFTDRFDAGSKQIKNKAESLMLYCQSKGRSYKNYKAFLLNALKKDFKERVKVEPKIIEKEISLTPEQKLKIEMEKQLIREKMKT